MVSLDGQLGYGVGLSLWLRDGLSHNVPQELTKNDPTAEAACRGLGSWSGSAQVKRCGNANGEPHLDPMSFALNGTRRVP